MLNELKDNNSSKKSKMRVGRGIGSGKGKTCGRGHKGQKSRSGVAIKGFEGGQTPLYSRLPKRGFTNVFRKIYTTINTGEIQKYIDSGRLKESDKITPEVLKEKGIIKKINSGLKILGKGELKSKINVESAFVSKSAEKIIEKAGGSIKKIEVKKPTGKKTKDTTKDNSKLKAGEKRKTKKQTAKKTTVKKSEVKKNTTKEK